MRRKEISNCNPSEAVEPLVSELSFPDAVGDDSHVDTATFEQTVKTT